MRSVPSSLLTLIIFIQSSPSIIVLIIILHCHHLHYHLSKSINISHRDLCQFEIRISIWKNLFSCVPHHEPNFTRSLESSQLNSPLSLSAENRTRLHLHRSSTLVQGKNQLRIPHYSKNTSLPFLSPSPKPPKVNI